MKKMVIAFLLVVCSVFYGNAQVINITSFFKASENQGKVLLSWQITEGNTCNGIQIFRGTDSTQLTQIGEIIGVCGSITEPIDYTFVDETFTENATYYYRLEFGTQGYSEIISIAVKGLFKGTSQARPNPISTTGQIFFNNPHGESYVLTLYNAVGLKVIEQNTKENFFAINATLLENGIYIYTINTVEGVLIAKEKIIINR